MVKYIREFIEYSGITKEIPDDIEAFKNIFLDKRFEISDKKPDIETFLKCSVQNKNIKSKLINGSLGVGETGEMLSGIRGVVEGELYCRVEYVENDFKRLVYADRRFIPYKIIVPLTKEYSYSNKLIPNIFLDDIYLEKVNNREYIVTISGIITIET